MLFRPQSQIHMKKIPLTLILLLISAAAAFSPLAAQTPLPKNLIVLIGDGMGIGQLTAMKMHLGDIALDAFPVGGFVSTQSLSNFVTESGAGGTALSTGERTRSRMISQRPDGTPLRTLLEQGGRVGKATGAVSTSSVTHATPASFLTHCEDRGREFDIAAGIAASGVNVVIGGGRQFFLPAAEGGKRSDGRNLVKEMQQAGYVYESRPDAEIAGDAKLLWLLDEDGLPPSDKRDYSLRNLVLAALHALSRDPEGFVLMVEGSQIDWAAHDNDFTALKSELRDFDGAIGAALDFAQGDGETLVLVTADHETGGLTLMGDAPDGSDMTGKWIHDDHTGNMVPLMAYGPAAERFGGIKRNDEVGRLLHELLR